MDLDHSFTVPVGIDDAWKVLLDIERVAPCMPGAALDTVDGDEFTGTVKVKVGPIGLTYKGKAGFVEKDEAAHRAVIDARGRDSRGNGTARAKVTATLSEDGDSSTKVDVHTELDITGKPAQFGRGVMVDVGNKLLGQFADCLAGKLAGGEETPAVEDASAAAEATPPVAEDMPAAGGQAAAAESAATVPTEPAARSEAGPTAQLAAKPTPTAAPSRTMTSADDVEAIDLFRSAGPAVAKRVLPVVATLLVILLVIRRRRG